MFEKAIEKDSLNLRYVPNDPKFLEMCEKVVKNVPCRLEYVPMSLITQKICEKAVEDGPWQDVPDHFRLKRCVKKPLQKTNEDFTIFLIVLRQKRSVKKPLKKILCA